jgi:hypothetical protein
MISLSPPPSSELCSSPELTFVERPVSTNPLHRMSAWLEGGSVGLIFSTIGLAIVLLTCLAAWKVGLPHIAIYGQDTFIMFDGGWRVLNGQRPSIDFYSAFGPVSYLLTALGMALSGKSPVAAVYTTIFGGV